MNVMPSDNGASAPQAKEQLNPAVARGVRRGRAPGGQRIGVLDPQRHVHGRGRARPEVAPTREHRVAHGAWGRGLGRGIWPPAATSIGSQTRSRASSASCVICGPSSKQSGLPSLQIRERRQAPSRSPRQFLMAPSLLERQLLRVRNGLTYYAGLNRRAVAQSPRDLVWRRDRGRLWRYRSRGAPRRSRRC